MASVPHPLIEQLKTCRFFSDVPHPTLRRLAKDFSPRSVRKGQLIFSKGDPASGLYLVLAGAITIFSVAQDGREVTYDTLGSGNVFGVASTLDGDCQTTSASAASDASLAFITRAHFLTVIREDEFAQAALLAAIAGRCRTLTSLVEEQRLYTTETRLARALLRVDASFGKKDRQIFFTQLQLGEMAGLSRGRASRLLRRWSEAGIIDVQRRKLSIVSHRALRLLAQPREIPSQEEDPARPVGRYRK